MVFPEFLKVTFNTLLRMEMDSKSSSAIFLVTDVKVGLISISFALTVTFGANLDFSAKALAARSILKTPPRIMVDPKSVFNVDKS